MTLKIESPILTDLSGDPILNATENFSHDATVLKIIDARNSSDCFCFNFVTTEDICRQIRALDASKATQSDEISTKIFKNNSDIFSRFFQENCNKATKTSSFPEQLKYADVKSVFLKKSPN